MKKLFVLSAILISFSCKEKESNTPTAPVVDTFDPGQSTLVKQGTLTGVGHSVSGTVKVYDDAGKKTIVLDPFSSQNGPDLKIYLSTDQNSTKYITLARSSLQLVSNLTMSLECLTLPSISLFWCGASNFPFFLEKLNYNR